VKLSVRHAGLSDIGLHRTSNEDAFVTQPPLFVVADGMGGAQAGEVASGLAVTTLAAAEETEPLVAAAQRANARIYEHAQANEDQAGMGTTLTAFRLHGSRAEFVHIGDSRAYLLRDGLLEQLTEDHSLVVQWVREGTMTAEEAAVNRFRSVLSRALGTEPEAEIDAFDFEFEPGDVVVLCSDGLSGPVAPATIADLAGRSDPEEAVHLLIRDAKNHGGPDNITAVVVQFHAGDELSTDEPVTMSSAGATTAELPKAGPVQSESASVTEATAPALRSPRASLPAATSVLTDATDRRPHHRVLKIAAVVLIALAALTMVAGIGLSRAYYVADDGGYVAVYRGVPFEIGGIGAHRLFMRTLTPVSALSLDDHQRLDAHDLMRKQTAMDRAAGLGAQP